MSALAGLKLVNAKQQRTTDPVLLRREKLVSKLDEQIAMAQAQAAGTTYAPQRSKRVKDSAGNVVTQQVPKRVKAWYWPVGGGRVCVALRYGNKVLELAKGKVAVEVGGVKELIGVLDALKRAVEAGELDAQIEATSASVRKAFKKK